MAVLPDSVIESRLLPMGDSALLLGVPALVIP